MKKVNTDKIIDGTLKVVSDLSTIILGTKKDGSPRSIVDAKLDIEKEKRKTIKKMRKKKL